jgi:hypothetical protein
VHWVAPGTLSVAQVPNVAPVALVQVPVQHSASVAHTSLVCVQKEGWPAHTPLRQTLEQHSSLPPQVLPEVRQLLLSGTHFLVPPSGPSAHFPPQHSPSTEQVSLSDVHRSAPHLPPLHTKVQHSTELEHESPPFLQVPRPFTHVFVPGSQLALQQSALVAQLCPTIRQTPSCRPGSLPSSPASVPPVGTSELLEPHP